MTQATAKLVDEFRQLTPTERADFLEELVHPSSDAKEDLSEDDFSAIAAQSFARLDAEEEKDAND